MQLLENGSIEINGEEFAPDALMNMMHGECSSCGWHGVSNSFWIDYAFSRHDCLTKAGKPRKGPKRGFFRPATAMELFLSMRQEVSA